MKAFAKYYVAGIGILIALMLTGCGGSNTEAGEPPKEAIELLEPKGAYISTEAVARRNLYNATVYEGAVYPYVEEYCFRVNQLFGSYGALLGDTVQAGDVLVYADEDYILDKMESIEEKLADLKKEYEKFCGRMEETLSKQRDELEQLESILENMERMKPEEYLSQPFPDDTQPEKPSEPVANPEYAAWASEQMRWQGEYNLKEHTITVNEEELRRKRELYELDCGYYNGLLRDLEEQRKDERVVSQISGVVVDLGYYTSGNYIPRGMAVAAVADMEQEFVKCAPIARYLLANAADTYAFIGGKRYEVELAQSSNSGTSFYLKDENNEVSQGDYAVLVLVSDYREQVLAVPVAALFEEGEDSAVNVLENGQAVARQVKTGMSDGIYVEILSGLEEGEAVVVESQEAGKTTEILERATWELAYTGTGYLFFPRKTVVTNPVEQGKVIFQGIQQGLNEHVEKGDVLASIHVEPDSVDMASRETALRRAKERLADLEAQGREEDAEEIEQRREAIAEQEKELNRIKSQNSITEVCSPVAGTLESKCFVDAGDILSPNEWIAVISDDSFAYLMLDISQNKTLNYGDGLSLTYEDVGGVKQTVECRMLNLGHMGRGSDFLQDWAMLTVPPEALENMPISGRTYYGYGQRVPYIVVGSTSRMENVVLVPIKAVSTHGGKTYVNVLGEDGTVTPTAFLAGGKSKEYYWVIEGLTEGMKICWE